MRTKHNDGQITFELDTTERRHINNVIGTFTMLSVAASGELKGVAGDMVTGINHLLTLLGKQGEPTTPDDAAHADADTAVQDQTV